MRWVSKRQLRRERNEAVLKYNDLYKSVKELDQVVDAILYETVKEYGTDGTLTISAPRTTREKRTEAGKTDDGKLIIRLRRKHETERSDQESGPTQAEHD